MSATGTTIVRMLDPGDFDLLRSAGDDVFDDAVEPDRAEEFLADPRHHIAAAIVDGAIVGMATGVHYIHPDKPPELWINEVGVAAAHQRQGIGRRVVDALLEHARTLGCHEAWVLTEESNTTARRLYASAGGVEDRVVYVTFDLRGDRG